MNSIYNGCYRFVDTSFAVVSATVSSATKFISSVACAAIDASVDSAGWIVFREKYNRRKSLITLAKTVADEQVTHIAFPTKGIGPAEVGDCVKCLKGTKVNSIVLAAHTIDAVGALGFENLKDTEVRTVRLDSSYGPVLARGFAKHLKNTQVTTVDLSYNHIGSDGAREFVKSLKGTKVTTVNLMGNRIRDVGASDFAKHLKNTQVTTVDLSYNFIHSAGARDCAKNLKGTKVTTVKLRENFILADGAREFAEHLKNTQVTAVDLSYNDIGSDGARDFVKNLKGTKVSTVRLRQTGIKDDGAKEFAEHLKDTQVTAVDLSCNHIGGDGARDFVKNLKGTHVTTVFLEGNTISDHDLVELIRELSGTQVKELHVSGKPADSCYNRILSLIPLTNLIKLNVIGSKLPEALTVACEENKRRLDRIEATRMFVESNLYKGPSRAYNDEINSVNDVLCYLPEEIRKRALNASMGTHNFS